MLYIYVALAVVIGILLGVVTVILYRKHDNKKMRPERIDCFMQAYDIQKNAYYQAQEILRQMTACKDKQGLKEIEDKIGAERYAAYFPL